MAENTAKILLVDDEPTQHRLIGAAVQSSGYTIVSCHGGQEAIDLLNSPAGTTIDAVLLDISMPDVTGIDVLKAVRPHRPNLPIIVLTAYFSNSNVSGSMRAGATDFLVKPASGERIRTAIEAALDKNTLQGELRPLTEKIQTGGTFKDLIGASQAMANAISVATKAANSTIPVLIEGESGVGKEMFARAIQSASSRKDAPFVIVNCGAIPENLVESILFGHEKGAFTGASEAHSGKFLEADGGTIFLDEVGELPMETQVKLLRVLQEGEVDPVGSTTTQKVDVRVLSATNRSLSEEVTKGNFREDLYYRLNVFPVRIPPLRKRMEDIESLTTYFIQNVCNSENLAPKRIAPDALELLKHFRWPGNVRQLQNVMFRAVVLSDNDVMTMDDFPQVQAQMLANFGGEALEEAPGLRRTGPNALLNSPNISLLNDEGHVRPLSDIEAEVIGWALEHYHGRMTEVARRLKIGRSTLYRKVAEFHLETDFSEQDAPTRSVDVKRVNPMSYLYE
ncbi:MAG: sigma-54 dependent transcriptional regulator [Pseudomonadota bacterium]